MLDLNKISLYLFRYVAGLCVNVFTARRGAVGNRHVNGCVIVNAYFIGALMGICHSDASRYSQTMILAASEAAAYSASAVDSVMLF